MHLMLKMNLFLIRKHWHKDIKFEAELKGSKESAGGFLGGAMLSLRYGNGVIVILKQHNVHLGVSRCHS